MSIQTLLSWFFIESHQGFDCHIRYLWKSESWKFFSEVKHIYFLTIFYWVVIDLQPYISFKCETEWFDTFIHYDVIIKVGPLIICHHTKLLEYYWLYSSSWTLLSMTYFVTESLYHLFPSTNFIFTLKPSPFWWTPVCFLYLWVWVWVCFLFWLIHLFCFVSFSDSMVSEIIWYRAFSIWLISLSVMLFRSSHVVTSGKASFFFVVK